MIYEDALIRIEQAPTGTTQGHIVVYPKQQKNHFSELTENERKQFVTAANLAATALFETLGAQGTNIIINEEPLRCDVLARSENDPWTHQWSPVELEENAMSEAAEKINFSIPLEQKEIKDKRPSTDEMPSNKPRETPQAQNSEQSEEELEKKENYLIRQLYRVP